MNWISCKKRLPKPDKQPFEPVLFVLAVRGLTHVVCAGRFFTKPDTFESLQGRSYPKKSVSHWMPMPTPPADGERGK